MIKRKLILILLLLFLTNTILKAQFDKPQLQVGVGFTNPYDDLKGDYLETGILGSNYVLMVNSNLITNNYGGKNGLSFFGKGKINFDKYSTVRGVFGLSYSGFNTFESAKSGNIGVQIININNEIDTVLTSINYDYNFSAFNLGFGLELAPTSFTGIVSPYFGANFNLNFLGGELSRTENRYDSVKVSFSDFRIGVNFDAGIEAKISKGVGLAVGLKYDLGNLLLKNTNGSIADVIEYGKGNASINDEQGRFYSTIYGPVLTSIRKEVLSKEKKINWGTAYIALNIDLFSPPSPKKSKTKKTN